MSASNRAIREVFRFEQARLIAGLTRLVRDVGIAEELAQDALVAALEQWPKSGVPDNPGAWLMAASKHRAMNTLNRARLLDRKHEQLAHEPEAEAPDLDAALDENVGDDLLRLIFISCHPVLPIEQRVALTLRLLGGLTTEEIARAFLAPEPTIAQRIVRAKKTLAEAKVPFEVPRGDELGERLGAVFSVIYLVFNEGYSATAGDDVVRPALCEDALRLGRVLAGLVPAEPEAHGLVALMELNASRMNARVGPNGEPLLLSEQNRARWDQLLIQRGLAALEKAGEGPYGLQAAIAACHARARAADETDWKQIAALYEKLVVVAPSPVVQLNRAVAVSRAFGAVEGLRLADALEKEPALKGYHLLPAARADFLARLGRFADAAGEFRRAAELTQNEQQRATLSARAAECDAGTWKPR